jgi:magnesium transporter
MARFLKKISRKAGLPPGTLVHIGEQKTGMATYRLIRYGPDLHSETEPATVEEALAAGGEAGVEWLNVDGLHELQVVEAVGARYGIHPLILEDVVNTTQRPKFELFDEYVYLVLQMIRYDAESRQIRSEQVSLLFGKSFLVSFQEAPGDVFEPIRGRLRQGRGKIRRMGPDYLAYCILDAVVDHYFHVLEGLSEEIESLEQDVMEAAAQETLQAIHRLKHEMIYLRKQVWPIRELLGGLRKAETDLVRAETQIYFSDVHDHAVQALEIVESLRDLLAGLQDLYMSELSNRMNEVMKVLTLIATIFIPISFIAGVFGMNFRYMPELDRPWGYPAALALMAAVAVGLLVYFRRKHWF